MMEDAGDGNMAPPTEQEMREVLKEKLGREPTDEEIKNVMNDGETAFENHPLLGPDAPGN